MRRLARTTSRYLLPPMSKTILLSPTTLAVLCFDLCGGSPVSGADLVEPGLERQLRTTVLPLKCLGQWAHFIDGAES